MNIHKAIFAILTVLFGVAATITAYLGYAYMEFGTGLHPIFAGMGAMAFLLFGAWGSYYAASDPDDNPLTGDTVDDVIASLVNNDYFACEVAHYIDVDKIIRNLPHNPDFRGFMIPPDSPSTPEQQAELLTEVAHTRYSRVLEVMASYDAWLTKTQSEPMGLDTRMSAVCEYLNELHEIVDGQDDVIATTTDISKGDKHESSI